MRGEEDEGAAGVDGEEGAAGVAGGVDEDPDPFDGSLEVMAASICPMLSTVEVNWAWFWAKVFWVWAKRSWFFLVCN